MLGTRPQLRSDELTAELLERADALLWTFSGERLVRMDYYPNYRSSAIRFGAPGAR